jgi:hypothetical protein
MVVVADRVVVAVTLSVVKVGVREVPMVEVPDKTMLFPAFRKETGEL